VVRASRTCGRSSVSTRTETRLLIRSTAPRALGTRQHWSGVNGLTSGKGPNPRRASIPERLARRYVAASVGELAYGLILVVLVSVVMAIGILIFVALGAVVFGLYALLGEPRAFGLVVGLTWFGGSLLILFLVLLRGHRWLTRLMAIAEAPVALIDPYADQELLEAEAPAAWAEASVAGTGAATAASTRGFAKVDLPDSFWKPRHQDRAPASRRMGWLVVVIGISALMVFSVYLVIITADADPNDPGAADVAFFISPFLAAAAAIVTGILLALVASLRLIPLTIGRVGRALVAGVILGPVIYLIFLIVIASALDAAQSGLISAIVSFIAPTLCGIGVTLVTVLVQRPERRPSS